MLHVDPQAYRVLSLPERLAAQCMPEPNSGCWLWFGAVDRDGYGQIHVNSSSRKAHRVAYQIKHGKIRPGLVIDHLCRTPGCVNPDHMEPVTNRENVMRGLNGRMQTHCARGHPLSGENLLEWRGNRLCRQCRRRVFADWRRRNPRRKQVGG